MKNLFMLVIALVIVGTLSYLLMAQELELIFSHRYHAEEVGAPLGPIHVHVGRGYLLARGGAFLYPWGKW